MTGKVIDIVEWSRQAKPVECLVRLSFCRGSLRYKISGIRRSADDFQALAEALSAAVADLKAEAEEMARREGVD